MLCRCSQAPSAERSSLLLTSCFSLIQNHFAIGQTSEEESLGVFEAEDWAVVWVHEGQQALDCCVNAAVHQDAVKTSRNESNVSITLILSNIKIQIQLFKTRLT